MPAVAAQGPNAHLRTRQLLTLFSRKDSNISKVTDNPSTLIVQLALGVMDWSPLLHFLSRSGKTK
jgi:hypothetical protein